MTQVSHMYYTEETTDLAKMRAEASRRSITTPHEAGRTTVLHMHPHSHTCKGRSHTVYPADKPSYHVTEQFLSNFLLQE